MSIPINQRTNYPRIATLLLGSVLVLLGTLFLLSADDPAPRTPPPPKNTAVRFVPITRFTTGSEAQGVQIQQALIAGITSSTKSVHVAAYVLTDPQIVEALVTAHKRGVAVEVLLDEHLSDAGRLQYHYLQKNGVPVSIIASSGLMHEKVVIVDGETTYWGSYNFSKDAYQRNCEVLTQWTDIDNAKAFEGNFAAVRVFRKNDN